MKLLELINRVDKSPRNSSYFDPSTLSDIFNISFHWDSQEEFESRVKKYWIHPWVCTDTWVGLSVYYFDDKPLAISFQAARKSYEDIDFVSKEVAEEFYKFLLSLRKFSPSMISLANLEEEMGEGETVSYGEELMNSKVMYGGEEVEVVKKYGYYQGGDTEMWSKIDIQKKNGDQLTVSLSDVIIPYRIT